MKLGILPILKGIFMNLIFGDGAIKQISSGNPLHKRNCPQKIQAVAYLPLSFRPNIADCSFSFCFFAPSSPLEKKRGKSL